MWPIRSVFCAPTPPNSHLLATARSSAVKQHTLLKDSKAGEKLRRGRDDSRCRSSASTPPSLSSP
ncbi:hypothetical protein E2C01_064847 [Portunus trituberculatus]|uniref:Uncharacterized protein n=1 Tax=Portunus trituberculatus TaxID=210409 RepID=A0A5B7HK96_PORTR|nr:hypothetical protein [Portunus trituberculatus]